MALSLCQHVFYTDGVGLAGTVAGLNTERRIEGHNLLIILKRKVLRRELNGIGGPVGIHIDLQALCLGVVGGLYLNRNQLPVTLNDEIYFGPAFGLPITGAQGRTRIGKKNFKKRWFCLTSRELTYHRQQGRVVLGLRCGFTLLVRGAAVIAAQ